MPNRNLIILATLILAACGTQPQASGGAAVADSVAYACAPVLVPGPDDDGVIGHFAPGPDDLMAWTTTDAVLKLGTSADAAVQVGRKGEGPGEFTWIDQLGWGGDTLYVTDLMLSRVQYFDRDGQLLGGERLPRGAGWRLTPDGRFVATGSKPLGATGWSVLEAVPDSVVPTVDTLFHFPEPEVPIVEIQMGDASMATQDPFAPTARTAASADLSWYCGSEPLTGDEVRIRCIDSRGNLIRDTVLVLAPVALSDEVWNLTIERFARGSANVRAAVETRFTRPDVLPRVTAMGVDVDGSLWLLRSHTSDPAQRWLRLDANGAVRDTLVLSSGYNIIRLSGDTMWRRVSDEDGMQRVERCVAASR